MGTPALELADIFRRHGRAYRAQHALSLQALRVMRAIEICRTAALGGHVEQCGHCAYQRIAYNSCRNRHCPKCQSLAKQQWIQRRKEELLPIPYFHVVFTVPPVIADIAFHNPSVVFQILFRASSAAMQIIAADPKHLGATIGFFSILHTWGQNLLFHPHVHCVATGGGLSPTRQWKATRPNFFLSVRVLSRLFRRLFLEALERAYQDGELSFSGNLHSLQDPLAFQHYLQPARQAEWVVYAKPPFGGPEQVIDYLGRYTHRVALSNQRLLGCDDQQVTFQYKDYHSDNPQQSRSMTLPAQEFLRRFLLHVLPPGFQRIRHYGLFANRSRAENLAQCRELLLDPRPNLLPAHQQMLAVLAAIVEPVARCPRCQLGVMIRVQEIAAIRWPSVAPPRPQDSS